MCRILGVIADKNIASNLVYGLSAQNYAGEESCGIAWYNKGKLDSITGYGTVNRVFGATAEMLTKSHAFCGIGHAGCRTSCLQPIIVNDNLAFCADASKETVESMHRILKANSDAQYAVELMMHITEQPFAIVATRPEGIIAARNSGRMTLSFGRIKDDVRGFYVSSQSGVLSDAKFLHGIEPGEMLIMEKNNYHLHSVLDSADDTRCVQEPMFWQKPGNYCGGKETSLIRQEVGACLGEKFRKSLKAKVSRRKYMIGIPVREGGVSIIIGFLKTAGIPCDPAGSIKSHYPKNESLPANIDLWPIEDLVKEKEVVIVDDAMITGGKITVMAQRAREFKARKVHGVFAAVIGKSCPYGKDILAGNSPIDNISKLGLDSITYLNREELIRAMGIARHNYCGECLI